MMSQWLKLFMGAVIVLLVLSIVGNFFLYLLVDKLDSKMRIQADTQKQIIQTINSIIAANKEYRYLQSQLDNLKNQYKELERQQGGWMQYIWDSTH
jgi:Tfp pilus assembly protein PilO